mmetsp:Transcript_63983/g.208713  ORF Transcript_63983/g.208713 Transcript_63983/m.208713 type:complete len:392 (+) Transcript_63983:436-1611(+)
MVAQDDGSQLAIRREGAQHILVGLARLATEDLEQILQKRGVCHDRNLSLWTLRQPLQEQHRPLVDVLIRLPLWLPGRVLVAEEHALRGPILCLGLPIPLSEPRVFLVLRHGPALVAVELAVPLATQVVHEERLQVRSRAATSGPEDDVCGLQATPQRRDDDEVDVSPVVRVDDQVPVHLPAERIALVAPGLCELSIGVIFSPGRGVVHGAVLLHALDFDSGRLGQSLSLLWRLPVGQCFPLCLLVRCLDHRLRPVTGLSRDDIVEALGVPHEVHARAAGAQEHRELRATLGRGGLRLGRCHRHRVVLGHHRHAQTGLVLQVDVRERGRHGAALEGGGAKVVERREGRHRGLELTDFAAVQHGAIGDAAVKYTCRLRCVQVRVEVHLCRPHP